MDIGEGDACIIVIQRTDPNPDAELQPSPTMERDPVQSNAISCIIEILRDASRLQHFDNQLAVHGYTDSWVQRQAKRLWYIACLGELIVDVVNVIGVSNVVGVVGADIGQEECYTFWAKPNVGFDGWEHAEAGGWDGDLGKYRVRQGLDWDCFQCWVERTEVES